jgi:putative DNA primase/helicase
MKCGLIATAGELAIKLGVLPWPPGTAINAAIYVFGLWRRQRGTDGSYELQEALERIQSLFERSSNSRFDLTGPNADLGSERPAPNRLGWTEGGGDDQQWYILPATWKKEICGGLDPKVLNSELKKLGALILGVERDGDRLRWRPKYVTIRGKQTRCYIVTTKIFEVVLRPSEEGFDD